PVRTGELSAKRTEGVSRGADRAGRPDPHPRLRRDFPRKRGKREKDARAPPCARPAHKCRRPRASALARPAAIWVSLIRKLSASRTPGSAMLTVTLPPAGGEIRPLMAGLKISGPRSPTR